MQKVKWVLTIVSAVVALGFWSPASGQATLSEVLEAVEDGTPLVTPDRVHPRWDDYEPEFRPVICPFPLAGAYSSEEFQCGYVLVPEDRTHRASRLIQIMVLKIASTSADPPGGALLRLTGGPGGPSLSSGRINAYRGGANASVRAAADLIFFDQRGTGYSEGRFCRGALQAYQFGDPTLTTGLDKYLENRRQCLAEARARGVYVDGYTNWQNALDVRDIRRALGYDEWTLFGVSYGTELGQAVMTFDAEGTRAAILDSVVPTGLVTNSTDVLLGNGFRSALTAVDEMCRANAACQRTYGDQMSDRILAAIRSYDDEPITLTGLDTNRAINGRLFLDASLAGSAVFQALYNRSVFADLPAFLRVLESRDEEALRAYVNEIGYPIDHAYGYGMALTINCRAGFREDPAAPPPPGPDGSDLADIIGGSNSFQTCGDVYPTSPDPSVARLQSDIPTLIVTGAVDPITPPYYADILMEGLSNAQRVDFPNTGHGGLVSNWSACGRSLLLAFLTDPLAPVDTSCAELTAGPDFLVSLRETRAPYRFALDLQSGTYPAFTVAMAGGLVAILASFLITPLARRIDGRSSANYGRARLLAWFGGALSLGGLAWAVQTVIDTGQNHTASLVVGVPSSIAWAGWLGVAGFALCVLALWRVASTHNEGHTLGTRLAIALAALQTGGLLWFLFSIGAGPF
ncbi:MAG: alpha/beta hydrolase [Pseudomonadota bacterium]